LTTPTVEQLLVELLAVLRELTAELSALREHNRSLGLNPKGRRRPRSGVL
jgi:hypothetical protein